MQTLTGRPSVIVLKGRIDERMEEGRAAGAIKPGHLIILGSGGTYTVNNAAAQTPVTARPMAIATEDGQVMQGKNILDAYASGDLITFHLAKPGDLVQVWLKDGENVAVGALLESALAGEVQIATTGLARFEAQEALNLSGGATEAGLIRALVLR